MATLDVENWWEPARDVSFTRGYPDFFDGVLNKLSYAEITIESVSIIETAFNLCILSLRHVFSLTQLGQ